ncbi:hypothetical protein HPB51_021227 [Rhipicephalus microplus]|uniref:Uncharacterized protein n=1 Tax=Rhipicephalus microplus TaxID=6941 RepID=A0A9J6F7K1_RHIMP|nr:hypothetical protein HPB51_021227 [Rhipicephalus microplus]
MDLVISVPATNSSRVTSSRLCTSAVPQEPVLSLFLGLTFALALRHGTSLYTRASFALLRCFGTRVRSLMLGFLGCTLVLTQVLGASLAAVLMVYTVECAVAEIQNDVIREEQFKGRATPSKTKTSTKTTGTLSTSLSTPQPSLDHFPVVANLPSTLKAASDNSCATTAPRSAALSDQCPQQMQEQQPQASASKTTASSGAEKFKLRGTVHVNLNVDSASAPLQATKRSSLAVTPSRSVLDGSPPDRELRRASMRDRKISIYERGKTLRPGEEDLSVVRGAIEPKKSLTRKKSSIFGSIREFISKDPFARSRVLKKPAQTPSKRSAAVQTRAGEIWLVFTNHDNHKV